MRGGHSAPTPTFHLPSKHLASQAGQETRRGKGGGAECRDDEKDGEGEKEAERSSRKEEEKVQQCNEDNASSSELNIITKAE